MVPLDREGSIQRINELAGRRVPFVFLISFSGQENLITEAEVAEKNGIYLEMPGTRLHSLNPGPGPALELTPDPVSKERYRRAFEYVQEEILYGNSFLLNLTFPSRVESNLGLKDIFLRSRAPFKLHLEDLFTVFSPERFVRIRGRCIASNPMKGTMDASLPGAFERLATDPKEDAEHNTIVDLIRNDLSMIASDVRVKRFKYIDRVETHRGGLLQMSSEVDGTLPAGFHERLGELIFRLLPAGSICGAPKQKTLEIISKAEGYERGWYTGIFGYYDGENLDSAVAIRFMEKSGGQLWFKSGGGITYQSRFEHEYEELIKKVYVPIY